jgi:hypothetical protein
MTPRFKVPPNSDGSSFAMGPAVADPNTGGPFAMFNKNIESERRKFVTADACNLANPLNMDYCYERSRQRMHGIGAQTKLAAQKFNGCSARGWVMLVHIPSPRNPGQVVWCLVWHTLKYVLPPMPLHLPADFTYSDDVSISKPRDGRVAHDFYTAPENKPELAKSIELEREQAEIVYGTLRAVTNIPHDATMSRDENMRSLTPFMFVGEIVADGPNRGKGGLQEVTSFANHFGVKSYSAARYRDRQYHPFLAPDAKNKSYCIEKSPALHAWVRVSPEDAADAKNRVALCHNMLPDARLKLLEKYKTTGGLSPNMELSSADVDRIERRHYQFGTILDLNENGIRAFCQATAHDLLMHATNIIGSSPKPLRDESNRLKNVPTWGAALRSWQREQENTKLAGGGGHPQKQMHRAESEYDYTRHFNLVKVMLLGAIPVVDAHDSNVFTTPQVMRTLEAVGPRVGRPSNDSVFHYVEGVRWTRVGGHNWQRFLGLLPPAAEGCVVYLREAGEFVKCKRTTGVLKMARESTVVTHFGLQEIRATFVHQGTVMNKKLVCGAYMRPVAGMVPQETDYLTWVRCNDTDKQVPPTKDAQLTAACTAMLRAREARVLEMAGKTHRADKQVGKLVHRISLSKEQLDVSNPDRAWLLQALKRGESVRVQITGAGGEIYDFKPEVKCRLQEDVFYYVVCRFLRPPPARSLIARIEDVEFVILCSEKGVYGNIIERFDIVKLRSATVRSDQFFLTTWSLPRAPGPSHKERIDPRLVWTRSIKAIQYTLPLALLVRKWGIRNGYGDTYEETLDEETLDEADAQTRKRSAEVVVIDSDSDDDRAGARAGGARAGGSGAGGSGAGGSRAAASAARVDVAVRSDSESDQDPDSPGTQWRKNQLRKLSARLDGPQKTHRTTCMYGDLTLDLSRLYV